MKIWHWLVVIAVITSFMTGLACIMINMIDLPNETIVYKTHEYVI